MIPYFVEVLKDTPNAESKELIEEGVSLFVDRLTGKQTIFQCIRLDEEVVKRGGKKCEPGVYKTEYLRRLGVHIKNRIKDLTENSDKAHEYIVPGGLQLLKLLSEKGCNLYLASGTDETDVINEACLLGLDKYFGKHIYGAHDAMTDCSKEAVIKDIIDRNNLTGEELLSFGDGYVEIELVSDVGGYSVGAATDEVRRKGINPVKRERLLEGGADLIIPDFAEPQELIAFLFRDDE
jgi:phosphoglycolate phosphatase-like HAD superfamily hydrolase